MSKYILIIAALLTACSSTPPSDSAPDGKSAVAAKAADVSVDGLKEKLEALQHEYALPSLHAWIVDRDATPFKYSQGLRAVDHEAKVAAGDVYNLGSFSRHITAIMVAQLIDLKITTWDAKITEFLPPKYKIHSQLRDVTLEMLLAQRAGLVDVQKLKVWPGLSQMSVARGRDLLVESILSSPPQFTPGSRMEASPAASVVLGWILQKLTNFSYEQLAKNKIFLPLGMGSCGFGPVGNPKALTPDQPWGHTLSQFKVTSVKPSAQTEMPAAMAPANGLHCNTEDWLKLGREVNQGLYSESTLLLETTFQKLLAKQASDTSTLGSFQVFDRAWAGGRAFTTTGNNTLFTNLTVLAPAREMVLIVQTNSGTPKAQEGATKALKLLTEAVH